MAGGPLKVESRLCRHVNSDDDDDDDGVLSIILKAYYQTYLLLPQYFVFLLCRASAFGVFTVLSAGQKLV